MEQLEQHRPTSRCWTCAFPIPTASSCSGASASSHPDLPVIITTAYMSIEPQLKVLDLPHSGYIVKPFRLDELGARIDAVL